MLIPGLLLSTVIALAEIAGVGEHTNHSQVRIVPLVPLTGAESEMSFAGVERALSRLPIRAGAALNVDSALMSALAAAVESMPDRLRPAAVERMERLLHKGWPDPAAAQLGSLLMRYHAFRQAEKQLWSELPGNTVDADAARFEATRVLQLRYFEPATARSLFGEHNALAAYSLQLRRVDEDPVRTEAQKATAREALQRSYERKLRALRASPRSIEE